MGGKWGQRRARPGGGTGAATAARETRPATGEQVGLPGPAQVPPSSCHGSWHRHPGGRGRSKCPNLQSRWETGEGTKTWAEVRVPITKKGGGTQLLSKCHRNGRRTYRDAPSQPGSDSSPSPRVSVACLVPPPLPLPPHSQEASAPRRGCY